MFRFRVCGKHCNKINNCATVYIVIISIKKTISANYLRGKKIMKKKNSKTSKKNCMKIEKKNQECRNKTIIFAFSQWAYYVNNLFTRNNQNITHSLKIKQENAKLFTQILFCYISYDSHIYSVSLQFN